MLTAIGVFVLYLINLVALLVAIAIHGYIKESTTLKFWESRRRLIYAVQYEDGWKFFFVKRVCPRALHANVVIYGKLYKDYNFVTLANRDNFWSSKT